MMTKCITIYTETMQLLSGNVTEKSVETEQMSCSYSAGKVGLDIHLSVVLYIHTYICPFTKSFLICMKYACR